MTFRDHRAPVWLIWGLIALFGVLEAVAWTVAGGIPTRPVVVVQVICDPIRLHQDVVCVIGHRCLSCLFN